MLQELIHPVSLSTFFSEYFERAPLYVARPLPAWCHDLPSIDDLEAIIGYTSAPKSADELIRGSDDYGVEYGTIARDPRGYPDMSALYRAYANGWTIALYGLQRRFSPITRLAKSLANEIGHDVHVNLYCTPSNARALKLHADSHDVIILQLEGRKSWRIFGPQYLLPLEEQIVRLQRDEAGNPVELGDPVLEPSTEPGQILYLPRGYIHRAAETSVASMHLTIGIRPLRWLDLLEAGLRIAAEQDVRFRRSAPLLDPDDGLTTDDLAHEFASLIQSVQGSRVVREALRRCREARDQLSTTSPDPHFKNIEQARSLTASTQVVRRLGLRPRSIRDDERIRIEFGTRSLSAPMGAARTMEFIATHERFQVTDLPDELSERSKIVLVRRLIQEGLLRITEDETQPNRSIHSSPIE